MWEVEACYPCSANYSWRRLVNNSWVWRPPFFYFADKRTIFARRWNLTNDSCIESTVGLLFFLLEARLIRVMMFFLDPFVRLVVHFAHQLARGGYLIEDGCENGNSAS